MEDNAFMGAREEKPIEKRRTIHSSDILPRTIEQRHLKGIYAIEIGNVADRPDGTTHIKAYFALDESKLYIYNSTNSAWEGVTLST